MLRFFINNPVFSSVISIIIVLCGVIAILNLPLEEYPNITPPTITLSAHYPGANAKVLEKTVASPIEDQINGTPNMIYMNSTLSSNGEYNLIITFATGTNLNDVIGDVLNRLNSALPVLPQIVQQLGVTVRKSSQNLLMSISILSDGRYDDIYLSNYVKRSIYTELSRIKGVGDIAIIGDRTYSMRIWLQPDKMAKLKVTVNDIQNAIQDQNIQVAIGKTGYPPTLGDPTTSFNLNGPSYYSTPEEFENIIIRNENNSYIRIKDVARVELGAQNYDTLSKLNLNNSVTLQIYLDSSSNQLKVHNLVLDSINKLSRQFPEGITYKVAFDGTKFIEKALNNVFITLRDACILVVLVIFLFLQKLRATLIPILTIPVSIIGTFAIMYIFGFSINNLTLFGLILSIGIVVDDSIVVIENVERVMREKSMNAKDASIYTMQEVASALVAIVLVLCCAFIPSSFLGGLSGILYKQFAITISIAVIISGITALTLTPALCSLMLDGREKQYFKFLTRFFESFNSSLTKLTNQYIKIVHYIIKKRQIFLGVFVILTLTTWLIYYFIPIGFIPNEDKGFFTTQITLPQNSSLTQSEKITESYIRFLSQNSNIDNNISLVGVDSLNFNSQKTSVATVISDLIPWDKRNATVEEIINLSNEYGSKQKGANFIAYNTPAISGLSQTNGIEFYLYDKIEGNFNNLYFYLYSLTNELKTAPGIKDAYFAFNPNTTEAQILVDPLKAKLYGLNVSDVYLALQSNFGPNLVNYFYKMGDVYWVTLQSDYKYRKTPFDLSSLQVKNNTGQMVPISSVATVKFNSEPEVIERFNDYLGAKVVVEPNSGFTIDDTMKTISKICSNILPKTYNYDWYGVSYQQEANNVSSIIAFIFGLTLIFLVLASQFEMWRLPLVIICGMPFALFGAGFVLMLRHLSNDLYFQISLIALLGLSAKNSILITEFALHHYKEGMDTVDAALHAVKERFRPILMTSLAFILGALPLMFASGANSNAENSIGSGIVGGMLGSTFIATLFTPMFFVVIMNKKYKS